MLERSLTPSPARLRPPRLPYSNAASPALRPTEGGAPPFAPPHCALSIDPVSPAPRRAEDEVRFWARLLGPVLCAPPALGPSLIKPESRPGPALRSRPAGWEAPLTAIPNGPATLCPSSYSPGPSQDAGPTPQALPPPPSHSPPRLSRPPGPCRVRPRPRHAPSLPQHLPKPALSCQPQPPAGRPLAPTLAFQGGCIRVQPGNPERRGSGLRSKSRPLSGGG